MHGERHAASASEGLPGYLCSMRIHRRDNIVVALSAIERRPMREREHCSMQRDNAWQARDLGQCALVVPCIARRATLSHTNGTDCLVVIRSTYFICINRRSSCDCMCALLDNPRADSVACLYVPALSEFGEASSRLALTNNSRVQTTVPAAGSTAGYCFDAEAHGGQPA